MIPVQDNLRTQVPPIVTWTLAGLIAVVYVWDRGGNVLGGPMAFSDLAFRPAEITAALSGAGAMADLGKLFTSNFLHANLAHVIANLLFLIALAPTVEAALGGPRFGLYYLFWGVSAFGAQIYAAPMSQSHVLGASGAIGGVLGSYFLLFPGSRIRVVVPPLLFWPFTIPAWTLLGLWFVTQFFIPSEGVATWAHIGGFVAGMLTVLVGGGRTAILKGKDFQVDQDFEDD